MHKKILSYEFLEHPADIKICARGKNLPEVFINAGLAMMEFLFGEDINIKKGQATKINIVVTGENTETLLVNWLSELLFICEIKHAAITKIVIEDFSEQKISAQLSLVSAQAHDSIKGVTYHELQIVKNATGVFEAYVVFDI